MPRISTGPFGTASKYPTCAICGMSFLCTSDLKHHGNLHDPRTKIEYPFDTGKAKVESHINSSRHMYKCRFDSSCPKSYASCSARRHHEKEKHGFCVQKYVRKANSGEDDQSVTLIPDIVVTGPESPTLAPPETVSSPEDGSSEKLKRLAIDSPCVTPHSPLCTSFGDLRLRALQPMSAGSAQRPTLPGVQSILAQCTDHGAFDSAAADRGPQLLDLPPPDRPPNERSYSTTSRHGASQARLDPQLVQGSFEGETKVTRLGKEYLVSFRMSIKENSH